MKTFHLLTPLTITVSQQNPDNVLYLCETKQLATEENRLIDALAHLDNILKTLAQCLNKKALAQCPGDILWPFGHAQNKKCLISALFDS